MKVNGIMYKQGEIVLVPFPYSDLSSTKRRPLLIASNNKYNEKCNDVVVCVISSQISKHDAYSIDLSNDDLEYGILPEKSTIKTHKLFTIDKNKILKKFSIVKYTLLDKVSSMLTDLFESGKS